MRFDSTNANKRSSLLTKKEPGINRKAWLVGGVIVILLILGAFWFNGSRNNETLPASEKVSDTNSVEAEQENTPSQDKAGNTTGSEPQNNDQTPVATTTPATPPKTPSGNFVSNHKPRLGDTLLSTCSTTPAAKCNVSFSKDGLTKSLGEKTADSDGSVYWTWKPSDVGLTAASWQITVTASNGDKTASANDEIKLEVQP